MVQVARDNSGHCRLCRMHVDLCRIVCLSEAGAMVHDARYGNATWMHQWCCVREVVSLAGTYQGASQGLLSGKSTRLILLLELAPVRADNACFSYLKRFFLIFTAFWWHFSCCQRRRIVHWRKLNGIFRTNRRVCSIAIFGGCQLAQRTCSEQDGSVMFPYLVP